MNFIAWFHSGNGYITTATLREILHELDDKLTPDDLDGIINEIDEDGSGTIDFDGKRIAFHVPLPESNLAMRFPF